MDQAAKIRQKIDIVSLIQEYIPLKKTGHNFKANCPFHGEKTPSFVVSPERQIWHCFGCGKGGDIFTFLMEYERMEFPEALRTLAQKAGVVLENQKFDKGLSSKKEKIYALNHLAAEFYHYLLTKHSIGKQALQYLLEKRKINPKVIETYMLGFAPSSGSALVTYLLKKKKYQREEIVESGLSTFRGKDLADFFQGRLMFPLYDHRDNIVGFSGRVLNDTDKTSKYINTRETLVYHKGMTFFGLNSAKQAIKKEDAALLMEGEFDVITAFQEGIANAVAVKGTALTEDQVNLLARFCKKVILCFDMDDAGREALKRSVPLLEKKGLVSTVLVQTAGKDPDEAIKEDPIAFKKALKQDVGVYDYLIEESVKRNGTRSSLGKRQIGDEILPLLNGIDNEIVKEHYLQLLGRTIQTSYDSLVKAIDKFKKYEVVKKDVILTSTAQSREERLEEYLTALIIQSPLCAKLLEAIQPFLQSYVWKVSAFQKILLHLTKYFEAHPESVVKDALSGLPEELSTAFDRCFLLPLPEFDDEQKYILEVKRKADELHKIYIRSQIQSIGEQIKQKEKEGALEEVTQLQADFSHFLGLLGEK